MKFGIIQCIKCHHALGVKLRFKSVKCPFCNMKLSIIPEKIQHKSNSEKDLEIIISKLNQQLQFEEINLQPKGTLQPKDFESELIAAKKIGINEEVRTDHKSVYEDLDPFKRIAIKYDEEDKSFKLMQKLVLELGRELGEFMVEDFQRLIQICGFEKDKSAEYLEQLKDLDIIYEPRSGKYRVIED